MVSVWSEQYFHLLHAVICDKFYFIPIQITIYNKYTVFFSLLKFWPNIIPLDSNHLDNVGFVKFSFEKTDSFKTISSLSLDPLMLKVIIWWRYFRIWNSFHNFLLLFIFNNIGLSYLLKQAVFPFFYSVKLVQSVK